MANVIEVPIKWYQIKDYPKYEVSNHGTIRNKKTKKILKGYWWKGRRFYVKLLNEKGRKDFSIAKIVYTNIIGEIPKGYGVYHINGFLNDNAVWNLKALPFNKIGKLTGHRTKQTQPVILLDDNGEIKDFYKSGREASIKLHCSYQTVYDILKGKVKKPMFNLRYEKWADFNN